MKRISLLLILLSLLLSTAGLAAGEKKAAEKGEIDKKAADEYPILLAKAKDFDRSVDFKALRLAYTKTGDYKPYGADESAKDAMFKALQEKRYEDAIKSAEAIMDKNFVDIDAHFIARIAHRELKNQKKYEFHHFISKGLIDSILNSGTGLDTEGAFLVINTREEYVILEILGLAGKGQQTVNASGQTYDKLNVVDRKTGDSGFIFFNATIPFEWLNREFRK